MSAAAETLPPSLPKKGGGDFADWLSPVLVKELRQGLRSRAFTGIFVGVHAIMIFMVAMWMASNLGKDGASDPSGRDAFFWTLLGGAMLVAFPLRGMAALTSEVKAKTLDLVQLTHLGAMRIVTGKWLAIVAQSALVAVSVLPYAALRYFFGRVNVTDDLIAIGFLFLGSLLFTALAVAASLLAPILRGLLVFVIVYSGLAGGVGFMFGSRSGSFFGPFGFGVSGWLAAGLAVLLAAAYIWLALTDAAAKIAPAVENFASPRRAVSLALLGGLALASAWVNENTVVALGLAIAPFLAWVCVTSLCENTVEVPALYRRWARSGWLGRLAGRVLYPGCATAVLFSVIASFFWALILSVSTPSRSVPGGVEEFEMLLMIGLPLSVVFPALLFAWFEVKEAARVWVYALIQILCSIVAGSVSGFSPDKIALEKILSFVPTCGLILGQDDKAKSVESLAAVAVGGTVITGLFAVRIWKSFRWISQLERQSLASGRDQG